MDVNMPLIYGEGNKAFHRLQLELIQKTNEHTIFAWEPYDLSADIDGYGVLAPHPRAFKHSSGIVVRRPDLNETYEMTNGGLRITLQFPTVEQNPTVGLLNCQNSSGDVVGIWLESTSRDSYSGKFFKRPDSHLLLLSQKEISEFYQEYSGLTKVLIREWTAPRTQELIDDSKDTRIRVTLPSGSASGFQLQIVELESPIEAPHFQEGSWHGNGEVVELPYDTPGGFLFSGDVTSFQISIGSHGKILWSGIETVEPGGDPSIVRACLRNTLHGCMQGPETWKYLGDHRSITLSDQTTVTMRAKKTNQEASNFFKSAEGPSTIWDVKITICNPGRGAILTTRSSQDEDITNAT